MSQRLWITILGVGFVLGFARNSLASTVIYNFETPNWIVGQLGPAANIVPDVGDPTFRTSFSSFSIGGPTFLPPIDGQYMSFAQLTLNFNQAVNRLTFVFQIGLQRHFGPFIQVVTPTETFTSSTFTVFGGTFLGGMLDFTPSTPFTTATIYGLNDMGDFGPGFPIPDAIDLDNLTLSTVPESSSLTLLGLAMPLLIVGAALKSKLNH